jgi:hypothetical protein
MRPISAQFNSATRQVTPDRPETYCAMRARPARGFFRRRIMSISGAGQTRVLGIVRWSIRTKRKMRPCRWDFSALPPACEPHRIIGRFKSATRTKLRIAHWLMWWIVAKSKEPLLSRAAACGLGSGPTS